MIVSGGELRLSDSSPSLARLSYFPRRGVGLVDAFASYGAIYRRQVWVSIVVSKRARATARLPLPVYSRGSSGRTVERESPYARLMARPNPRHDPFFFWLWTSSTFDVYGEAVWLKVRGRGGLPAELWPCHPSNLGVEARDGELFYTFLAGGTEPQFLIPASDVVHFKSYNPDTTARGLSPLEPLRQTLVNEDAARRATSAFWQNGARPAVWLSHKGTLSAPAAERLRERWDDLHGGVDSFGKTAVLEEGMEPHTLSLTAEEAQYIETRKLNREEVCAAYDMPPPAVHILDRATFSNITENLRSLYRDTMAPHLGGFEAAMDAQLAPDFGGEEYAEFKMDEVLRGDFERRAEAYRTLVNIGVPVNRIMDMENMEHVEGGDQSLVNSTMVPLPLVGRDRAQPAAGSAPSTLSADTVLTVTRRVAKRPSLADVDPVALTAGLNGSTADVLDLFHQARDAGDTPASFCERLWSLAQEGT